MSRRTLDEDARDLVQLRADLLAANACAEGLEAERDHHRAENARLRDQILSISGIFNGWANGSRSSRFRGAVKALTEIGAVLGPPWTERTR